MYPVILVPARNALASINCNQARLFSVFVIALDLSKWIEGAKCLW